MSPSIAAILLVLAPTSSPQENSSALARRLTCMNRFDLDHQPSGAPLVMLGSTHEPRIENLHIYPDGYVVYSVHIGSGELIDCRARLLPVRVSSLKAELLRTEVWRTPSQRHVQDGANESLFLDLGSSRRCRLQLSRASWMRTAATRAVQKTIDQLKKEICEGPCPEPKPGDHPSSP
jgi:hypothetical protein